MCLEDDTAAVFVRVSEQPESFGVNEANGRGDGRCRSPAPSTELWPEVCATVTAG